MNEKCVDCGRADACKNSNFCFACIAANVRREMRQSIEEVDSQLRPRSTQNRVNPSVTRVRATERDLVSSVKKENAKKIEKKSSQKKRLIRQEENKERRATVRGGVAASMNRGYRSRNMVKLNCVLCGAPIANGDLLSHKWLVHGETPSGGPSKYRRPNTWVSIVSGGLPGLGKRR